MDLFTLENVRRKLEKMRRGRKVILTAGTFDILHPGHIDYLKWCKSHGDLLIVCIVGDKRTRRRKGQGRPIVKEKWRASVVASLKPVDLVFISNRRPFDQRILRTIRPNVIVTSSDEPSKESKAGLASYLRVHHPEILLMMRSRASFPRKSSTRDLIVKIPKLAVTKR